MLRPLVEQAQNGDDEAFALLKTLLDAGMVRRRSVAGWAIYSPALDDSLVSGLASALSSWAIGLTGPYIGVSADERRTRRLWFGAALVVAALLLGSLSLLPHAGDSGLAVLLIVAMLGNYAFQLTSLIYNASVVNAAEGDNIVSLSSRGMALSFLGGAVGVGIMWLVTSGRLIPGVSGNGAPPCSAAT